jgi:ABC-type glycerol-3-phosphate transport system permease component
MQDEELAAIDKPAGAGRTLLASAIGLVYFSPVIWMVLAAFKTRADALAVNFQEVVHSVPTGKAEVVEASAIRGTECTVTRMRS